MSTRTWLSDRWNAYADFDLAAQLSDQRLRAAEQKSGEEREAVERAATERATKARAALLVGVLMIRIRQMRHDDFAVVCVV